MRVPIVADRPPAARLDEPLAVRRSTQLETTHNQAFPSAHHAHRPTLSIGLLTAYSFQQKRLRRQLPVPSAAFHARHTANSLHLQWENHLIHDTHATEHANQRKSSDGDRAPVAPHYGILRMQRRKPTCTNVCSTPPKHQQTPLRMLSSPATQSQDNVKLLPLHVGTHVGQRQ